MSRWTSQFLLAALVGILTATASFAQPPAAFEPAKPLVNSPFTPEESQKHFQIDPDCRIELVAAEPDVSAPVSIAFDEKGQLWVVEMHDYPNGPAPGEPGKSRIRVLTDEDGDGRYSNPRVFVDQLLFANSLMHWDGGVLVTTDGKLIYFKDTDGDGKSDLREVWFEGFATENPQLRCNHPTFGPDNWIYVANGLRNGKVKAVRPQWPKPAPDSAKLGEPVDIAGRDFRFNPFTGECEAVSGYGQFGLTFDDEGNRYVCSNRNPCMKVIIEERHLKLNPNLAVPSVVEDVSPAGEQSKLYPISRAWTTSNLHAGQFSAACGLIFYRGTALPQQFYNQSFTCDPTGNLVHFNNEAYNESKREFLASDETWFRPVNTAMGPDGALYIVDMYRAVIEHPDYMPTELKTRPDLSLGAERGRIWRVVAKTKEPGGVSPRSLPMPTDPVEIAKLVAHPNGWHRDIVQRMLVERRDDFHGNNEVVNQLWDQMLQGDSELGQIQSLRILDGIDRLTAKVLTHLASRETASIRVVREVVIQSGYRASVTTKPSDLQELLSQMRVVGNREDIDSDVRSLAMLVLGIAYPNDKTFVCERRWIGVQCFQSAPESQQIVARIAASNRPFLAHNIAECIKKLRESPETLHNAVKSPGRLRHSIDTLVSAACRDSDQQRSTAISAIITESILLDDSALDIVTPENQLRVMVFLALSRELAVHQPQYFEKLKDSAIQIEDRMLFAADVESAPDSVRTSVIECLPLLSPEKTAPKILKILLSDSSVEVHRKALESASRLPDPFGGELLLSNFSQRSPALRSTIISGLLASEARITKLLDLVESNQISFLEIGQTRLASLQQVKNPAIQERLKKLIAANAPADRSKVLEEYQAALTHEHDPLRGRELFAKNCAQCHKIGDLGVDVAPNISDSRVKTHEQLLVDILDPNRAIDNNYFSYTLIDTNGQVSTGVISSETSNSVTLKQPEGRTITVARSDIEQLKPNGVSLMPVGFEKQLTVAQLADVISFVKNWRYLDGQVPKEVIK